MIINSLLDTDLYKITMMQAVYENCSSWNVKYKLFFRKDVEFTYRMVEQISREIEHYCSLIFTTEELEYLGKLPFMKKGFINWLSEYSPGDLEGVNGHIKIRYENKMPYIEVEGPWLKTILFEVPILAIVNEIYFENVNVLFESGRKRLEKKVELIKKYRIKTAEFGTRRRLSGYWQRQVVKWLSMTPSFIGTSNVKLAMDFGIKPIGTMAHEWIMAGVGLNQPVIYSQQAMLGMWEDTYRGDLGIALTDTYGSDAFCRDFDMFHAKLFDGVRHDSGNPFTWMNKMIRHYESLGIDPRSKAYIFSDGLDVGKAIDIKFAFSSFPKISFGIGTNLTNDFPTHDALNVVFKMTECNGIPTVKLSDEPGKEMCEDPERLAYMKKIMKGKTNE